jgi:uncharacterized protein YecT (DUF1311 family)
MKSGLILAAAIALATTAHAQDDAIRNLQLREAEQRAWIAATRASYQEQFDAQEIACYQRFAVNDCLLDSRRTQREVLADLRRQEVLINDTQRKRRGAQQLLKTDEKLKTQD